MDPQGPPQPALGAAAKNAPVANPPAMGSEFRPHGGNIPPSPFFPGFPHPTSHMPYLFQQSFMPSLAGLAFPPSHGGAGAPVDLTGGTMKSDPTEFGAEQSKPTKKRRVARKKSEIIQLDDVKDEVDAVKSGGHWKDHWVIQLITIRGEMHTIFSQPPKQGDIGITIFKFFLHFFFHNDNVMCDVTNFVVALACHAFLWQSNAKFPVKSNI